MLFIIDVSASLADKDLENKKDNSSRSPTVLLPFSLYPRVHALFLYSVDNKNRNFNEHFNEDYTNGTYYPDFFIVCVTNFVIKSFTEQI